MNIKYFTFNLVKSTNYPVIHCSFFFVFVSGNPIICVFRFVTPSELNCAKQKRPFRMNIK